MVEKKKKDARDLEGKVDILSRLKYMALPLAVAAGSYFTPELKSKYNSLPEEDQYRYKALALTGAVLAGTIITVSSGYALYKQHEMKSEVVNEAAYDTQ